MPVSLTYKSIYLTMVLPYGRHHSARYCVIADLIKIPRGKTRFTYSKKPTPRPESVIDEIY